MRLRALEALAAWGDPVGYDLAAAALDDRHPAVRRSAAVALAQIDPHHCLEPLVQALGDEDHSVRQAVARVIGRIGEPALAIVVASLPNSALEAGALLALEHLPSYHAAATLRQYAQEKVTQALHYNELWRGIGLSTDGNDRLHLLADSLKVTARSHGTYALRAVGLLNDPQAIALAIKNLASKDPQQRANALEMLDSLSDRDLIRPLLRLWEITIPAAGMSPSSDDTTPTWLLTILRDPDPWLRACAALVACKVYHPQVQAQLVQLAHADPEALVCETAALGLPLKGDAPMNTLPTLSLMERILFLRRVPLFAGLPPAELKQVAMIAAEHYFVANEMIAHQGDIGDEMYIIVSGEVHVIVETDETTRVELARRKPGEYVGEMAIISDEPRMASLIALGDVRALCINQKQFEGILRERPETCLAVMRVLCARLKERAPLTTASLAGSAKG
jgi:HEAT repeat protein